MLLLAIPASWVVEGLIAFLNQQLPTPLQINAAEIAREPQAAGKASQQQGLEEKTTLKAFGLLTNGRFRE